MEEKRATGQKFRRAKFISQDKLLVLKGSTRPVLSFKPTEASDAPQTLSLTVRKPQTPQNAFPGSWSPGSRLKEVEDRAVQRIQRRIRIQTSARGKTPFKREWLQFHPQALAIAYLGKNLTGRAGGRLTRVEILSGSPGASGRRERVRGAGARSRVGRRTDRGSPGETGAKSRQAKRHWAGIRRGFSLRLVWPGRGGTPASSPRSSRPLGSPLPRSSIGLVKIPERTGSPRLTAIRLMAVPS